VYALGTLALGWPALAGRFLVGPQSDQYIAGYAFREFAAHVLRTTGGFPQWNPYQFGGMPFVAAMHGDIFYPTFLLRMVLPTDVAMTWGFIIHVFLAGLFTYLFLRRIHFGFAGALVGGLAYMMSGHIATYVHPGHDGKLFVSSLFPLLLWALVAFIRDRKAWAWGLIALVVGLQVLSPHPQLLQYSLLAAGAYSILLAVGITRDGPATRRDALLRLSAALGAVVLGLLIGAIQFLPVREYVAWSPRAAGIGSYDRATSFAKNPQEILNAYLPEFTGILDHYWGPNGIHFQGDYVGAAVLVLAGAGLAGFRNDPRRRDLWFWSIAIVVALLWALGGHTPFYQLVYHLVPGTKYFRAPDTVFFVGTLGIGVLAARGTERALAREIGTKYLGGWAAFAVLVALLALSGGLTAFAHSVAPDGRQEMVDANGGAVIAGALRSLAVVLVLCGAILWWRRAGSGTARTRTSGILAAIVVIVAGDLWLVNYQYWTFSPPASVLYAADPAVRYLEHLPQPGRVLTLPLAQPNSAANYEGSGLMVHDIRNVFGYHGNELGRYNTLTGIEQGGGPNIDSDRQVLGNPNVRRLTNLEYILTNSLRLPEVLPGAVQVAGPASDDPTGATDYVFRLPGDAPFAWVAPVIVKAADPAVLATVTDTRFDVATAALFDTSATTVPAVAPPASLPAPTGIAVHVDGYQPGQIALTLDRPAPGGSALIAAENYYPGWSARVDGHPAPIGRAQYALIGVALPAGARHVVLSFRSESYETGKVITLVALLVTFAGIAVGAVTEQRRRG